MPNRITTLLDIDDRGFKGSLKSIGSAVGEADGMFGKFKAGSTAAMDVVKQNAGAFALAGGAALVSFGVKAVGAFTDTAKAAIDLNTATGLGIEEASRWLGVADDYQVTGEAMATGLGKIAKTLDDTKWAKYGIETRDAGGHARSVNDILLDTFDMLSRVTNKTEQAAIGQKLFGKGYQSLTPILGHTRAEYEAMLGAVEKGQVITEAEAKKAEKTRLAQDALSDAFKEGTLAVGGFVAELSPMIEDASKAVTQITNLTDKLSFLAKLRVPTELIFGHDDEFIDKFLDNVEKAKDPTGWAETARETAKLTGAMGELASGSDAAATAADDLKTATAEATRKSDAYRTSIEEQKQSLADLYGIERTAVESKYAFAESSQQANTDIAILNDTLKDHRSTEDDVKNATDTAKASILKASEDYATLGGAALASKDGIKRQIDVLLLQAAQLAPDSPLRKFLLEYINDLHNIPANVSTTLSLEPVRSSTGVGPRRALAAGGIVRASPGGTDVTLAEAGHDEAVIPLDGKHNVGSTTNVYVTVHGSVMSERDLTRAVYDGIIDGQRRGELVAGLT